MTSSENADEQSGLRAFWTSLPGVLTGLAAVIGAVAALAALFAGGEENGSPSPPAPVAAQSGEPGSTAGSPPPPAATNAAPRPAESGCFADYFRGMPRDRITALEAGTRGLDVITENQSKVGAVGLRLTLDGRSIGALKFNFFRDNGLFKIASVVDGRCENLEDYSVVDGKDKRVVPNYYTVRLRLGGALYGLGFNGEDSIRMTFTSFVP